jgi:hypothetical protein
MTCIAFAYLQHVDLAAPRSTGQKNVGPSSGVTPIVPAVHRTIMARLFAPTSWAACSSASCM